VDEEWKLLPSGGKEQKESNAFYIFGRYAGAMLSNPKGSGYMCVYMK